MLMRKLRFFLTLVLTLPLMFQAEPPLHGESSMIVVPDQYPSIQEAVNAAEPGSTVFVRIGVYSEVVTVNKSLTLEGENSEATVVWGDGSQPVFHVTSSDVRVSGFTLRGFNRMLSSIFFDHVLNCSVASCIFENSFYGVKLEQSYNVSVTGNLITQNWYGSFVDSSVDCSVNNNTFISNQYRGCHLNSSSYCSITGNVVQRSNYGIRLESSHGCVLQNNRIWETVYHAIWLNYSVNCEITGNNASFNFQNGVIIRDSPGANVKNNVLAHNANIALSIQNSNQTTVTWNTVSHSGNSGVYVQSSNSCLIQDNVLEDCYNGMQVLSCEALHVRRNSFTRNFYGFKLHTTSNCTVDLNTLLNNSYYGLWMYVSDGNVFYHNNFVNNNIQAYVFNSSNTLDRLGEGNFWSNYHDEDVEPDGVGNTPYALNEDNVDNHPLMGVFRTFNTPQNLPVTIISNSTVSNFAYNAYSSTLTFNLSETRVAGFCRVCIPHALMDVNNLSIVIDDGLVETLFFNDAVYDNGTHRWIYFSFPEESRQITVITEFPHAFILLVAATLACWLCNAAAKRLKITRRPQAAQ